MSSKTVDISCPFILELRKNDPQLDKVFSTIGNITYYTHDDYFAHIVHTIIEQMMSKAIAEKNMNRLIDMCPNGVLTPSNVLLISIEKMKTAGIALSKCNAIHSVAHSFQNQPEFWENINQMTDADIMAELLSIKGIGPWTVKMLLLFCLGRQDILPFEDGAFMQVFRYLYGKENASSEGIKRITEKWHPYSSVIAIYFYRFLDGGYIARESIEV